MRTRFLAVCIGWLALVAPAMAAPHEVRLPLHDGKLRWADLSAAALPGVHLPDWRIGSGEVDLAGWRGSLFLAALNASCGQGCQVTVEDASLVFHIDVGKLPLNVDDAKAALRTFVATETPDATAAQARRYGLFLPDRVDPRHNLVVLIHGMDCGAEMLRPMDEMLTQQGFQVACFCYPADQALDDSVGFFEQQLAAVHETFPAMRFDLVGHSMGGLIARAYVEGHDYRGDVDHLLLVGTPNDGSPWTPFHLALKAQKEIEVSRSNPDWRWSWWITDGMGEAARDVTPGSKFLTSLDAESRRDGVKYTVIAGSHNVAATFGAAWTGRVADWMPEKVQSWAGFEQVHNELERTAQRLRDETGKGDGPVSVSSARLKGVDDVVIVPADHCSLFVGSPDNPPAAFATIVERLSKKPE